MRKVEGADPGKTWQGYQVKAVSLQLADEFVCNQLDFP